MSRQYWFYLDADGCSGCGACIMACKDKNNLPPGLLWRRLREKESGGYEQQGEGLANTVFACYLTLSCQHCRRPACVGTCPAEALYKREEDGLVLLNAEKCTACRLCQEACPFDALQFDGGSGIMGKCDGCVDLVKEGEKPVCVAGCPLRVLDFGELELLKDKYPGAVLYDATGNNKGETIPCLLLKPHRGLAGEK
jgi:anaerobic dimethyl sulfoxide reductase subunit B (iron-sulfur subunit)